MEAMNHAIMGSEPLDARQLRALCLLGLTGSFTGTAKRLHLTQSAISHSMKTLETEVGVVLIERSGRKAILTQAGQALVVRAERILGEMSRARGELTQLARWGGSQLRAGAGSAACAHLLPGVLQEFHRKFPQWQVELRSCDAQDCLDEVKDGVVDVALCPETPGTDRELEFRPLFTEEIRVAVPAGHALAGQKSIMPALVAKETLVSGTADCPLTQLVRGHFEREGVRLPASVIETGSMEAVRELVRLGTGIALLPGWVAAPRDGDASVCAVPLAGRKLTRRWGTAHRRGRRLSHGEETFVKLCQEAGERLTAGGN
jgi:DNA-binding transcriptional LysR family regulator